MDIERSGGSGVAWLSAQTRSNSIQDNSTLIPPKNDVRTDSMTTDITAIWSDEEEEFVDQETPENKTSTFKPVITRVSRRPKLKRAQSERVPSLELPNQPQQPPQPQPAIAEKVNWSFPIFLFSPSYQIISRIFEV